RLAGRGGRCGYGSRAGPERAVDLEVAATRQRAVDDRLLEDDAARAPCCERRSRDVMAGEPSAAGRRLDRRGQHPDRGRLPGPVRAEQAEDLTRFDPEIDALHGLDAARIALAQL